MNEVELKKKAEQLEQTLQLQLTQLKKDSEIWVKIGGALLIAGLISYTVTRKRRKNKNKRNLKLDVIGEEVNLEKTKRRAKKSSSFFPPFKKRLLLSLLSFGQAKLAEEFKRRKSVANEK